MKKLILIVGFVFLASCGGEELDQCGLDIQPYYLSLTVAPNPAIAGDPISVTVIGTNGQCEHFGEGSRVELFVNGYLFHFRNDRDQIDIFSTNTGASTVLYAEVPGWGVVHASTYIDGELIAATPVKVVVQ